MHPLVELDETAFPGLPACRAVGRDRSVPAPTLAFTRSRRNGTVVSADGRRKGDAGIQPNAMLLIYSVRGMGKKICDDKKN